MKKLCLILPILFALALFSSCKQTAKTDKGSTESAEGLIIYEKDGIRLTEMVSPVFDDATLTLEAPSPGTHFVGGIARFNFGVENYKLGMQTSDATENNCANSAKGQHIHLILNNEPYSAHYEKNFSKEVDDGKYIGLAFLSRSYHESIKADSAYQVFIFSSGNWKEGEPEFAFDPGAPHMFYSRPKGTYNGDDTKKVMLHFYLINSDLASNGYKVKATINDTEFVLDKWVPYAMEGLPDGETTVVLALIDAAGELVSSPFNPVTRTVTLAK